MACQACIHPEYNPVMGRPPKAAGEKMARVNLTLRTEDADYLRELAVAVFLAESQKEAVERLKRGERPSASMAVRYLIDEYQKRTGGHVVATVKRRR